jgi:hypothetical protein
MGHFIAFLVLSIFLVGAEPLASGRRAQAGEAIAQRRPQDDLEAAAESGTIDRRGRGTVQQRLRG